MRSKRSKQHAHRRTAKQIAGILSGALDDEGDPILRILEAELRNAYTAMDSRVARKPYLKGMK